MDRWTIQKLNETDDITFAISILNERGKTLSPYAPLGMKLQKAAHTLSLIKADREKILYENTEED